MNDYAMGALEALCWAVQILDEAKDAKQARRAIEDARDDLISGIATDFRDRLRTAPPS